MTASSPNTSRGGLSREDATRVLGGLVVETSVSAELVEAIAARAAELVLEHLAVTVPAVSEFLTPVEAAELMRCKPQRVYDLLSSRRLPKYNDGVRVLVRRADVDVYLRGVAPALPPSSPSRLRRAVAA